MGTGELFKNVATTLLLFKKDAHETSRNLHALKTAEIEYMNTQIHNLKRAVACLAVAFVALVAFSAYAFADGLDPAGDPLGTGSLIWKLWKGGALLPAIILAGFGAATLAAKYVPQLNEGKRRLYVAAAIAGLAIIAEPASRGETPNTGMILAAIGSFFTLVTAPTKAPVAKDGE